MNRDPQPFGPVLHRARNVRRIDPPTIMRRIAANDVKPNLSDWRAFRAKMDRDNFRSLHREATKARRIDILWLVGGAVAGTIAGLMIYAGAFQ